MSDAKPGLKTLNGEIQENHSQRRFARADVNIHGTYERVTGEPAAEGLICNLGGGGLRLASPEDLPRETVLNLRFRMPNTEHDITVRGKVVLSFYDAPRSSYLHGIAFTQIVRGDQAAIVTFIESIDHVASDSV